MLNGMRGLASLMALSFIAACGLISLHDNAEKKGHAAEAAPSVPADATPKPVANAWEARCAEILRGVACTEEYAPHTCKLGEHAEQGPNRCHATVALQKKLCAAKDFAQGLEAISCQPSLGASPTPADNKGPLDASPAALWQIKCEAAQKPTFCPQNYDPAVCQLGKQAAAGSNKCVAEMNLVTQICAERDYSKLAGAPSAMNCKAKLDFGPAAANQQGVLTGVCATLLAAGSACPANHDPRRCKLGEHVASGTNECDARRKLLGKLCEAGVFTPDKKAMTCGPDFKP